MKQVRVAFVSAVAGGLVWIGTPVSAQHHHPAPARHTPAAEPHVPGEQALKVGKKGDVEFTVRTAVGDMMLAPGRYQLQHRVDGSDHFVHFTELTKDVPPHSKSGGGAVKAHLGELKCRLEPLDKKASATRIYTRLEGDGARVTKVVVQGENAAHLFE